MMGLVIGIVRLKACGKHGKRGLGLMKIELSESENYLQIGELLFKRKGYRFYHCMTVTKEMCVDDMVKEYLKSCRLSTGVMPDEIN